MEILGKGSTVFVAILVGCLNFVKGNCHMNRSTFDLITHTLHRDVKYMYERPDQLNVDAIFGLSFAEAHVTALFHHKNAIFLSEKNRRMLEEISKLCKIVRMNGKKMVESSEFGKMVRPEIWEHKIFWKRGSFLRKPMASPDLTRAKAEYLIYQGTPAEDESSQCLNELVEGTEGFQCVVSNKCAEMLLRKDEPRGYPLTHRLLYVQTAIALRCRERLDLSFTSLKKNYCAAILQDLVDLEAMHFPPPSTDLAMEQILLCGMEGYLEFATSHYANIIAGWPNSHGCYSALGSDSGKKIRRRRSTGFMDHGCDNHACGVAAASLSLLVRAAVENCA